MQAMIDSSTTAFSIQSDTLTAPTAVTWSNYRTSDQSGELVVVLSVGKQFEPIWISDQCFWSIENSRVDVVQSEKSNMIFQGANEKRSERHTWLQRQKG